MEEKLDTLLKNQEELREKLDLVLAKLTELHGLVDRTGNHLDTRLDDLEKDVKGNY